MDRYLLTLGFATASAPAILYSIYRTGYAVYHFVSSDFLGYVWPAALATTALVAVVQAGMRGGRVLRFASGVFLAAFVSAAVGVYFQSWWDYKIWVYVIGPLLALALFCSAIISSMLPLRRSTA